MRLAGVQPGDHVVEVGPGLGSLTLALCDAGAHVRAVELDHRLAARAGGGRGRARRSTSCDADALEVDWPELLADHDRWIMVSNLPYNVATPVVMRALEHAPMIERFLVMVQREVGERLAAVPGTKAYGAVSVKVAYSRAGRRGRDRAARGVRAEAQGRQRARAAAAPREPPVAVADPERMFELVRAGFATRRKMLRRALDGACSADARRRGVRSARASIRRARAETLDAAAVGGARARRVDRARRRRCRVDAFAKLTLSLHVDRHARRRLPRARALVVPVSEPHDELVIRAGGRRRRSRSTGRTRRAFRPTTRTSRCAPRAALGANVAIELRKGIPPGAGLGGGSADAAAVLVGAPHGRRGRGRRPTTSSGSRPALGADVPFCLRGGGRDARARRRRRPRRR